MTGMGKTFIYDRMRDGTFGTDPVGFPFSGLERAGGHQVMEDRWHRDDQFRLVRKRSWTSQSCGGVWWGISRRFRKISSCWFAEVRQSTNSTDTLSLNTSVRVRRRP